MVSLLSKKMFSGISLTCLSVLLVRVKGLGRLDSRMSSQAEWSNVNGMDLEYP